uniref:Uncharacterized protein n=1 Tax=Acrobeloides nanus TaxID=290746 RepID=A0A914CJK9_9BILA
MEISRSEAQPNAKKGLSGEESNAVRIVGQARNYILGTFGAGKTPYSPDLSPSDYYLFHSLEHWLCGKKFITIEEMRESLTEFFESKDREWYRRGIHQLEEQWQKVIESGIL